MSKRSLQTIRNNLAQTGTIQLEARITPKSQQNQLIEVDITPDGKTRLKLKIRGLPEKGLVNLELIKYLAELLDLPKSHIEILTGHTSRTKIIRLIK